MRYFSLLILLLLTSIPAFTDDTPDITQVARFGRGTAYTLAWRPDGEVLAVGSSTGVWFFDEDFNELGRLAEDMTVDSLEWSPDGERLIAFNDSYQTEKCQLIIWNVSLDLQTVSQDKVFDYCAESVDWSNDGELIAFGVANRDSSESTVTIISSTTYDVTTRHENLGKFVAFSPNNESIAISGYIEQEPQLSIKDAYTDRTLLKITEYINAGKITWHSDGMSLMSACDIDRWEFWGYCIWDSNTGKLQYSEELFHISWIPNSDSYITWGSSPYGYNNTTIIDFGHSNTIWIGSVQSLAWHPSGEYFTVIHRQHGVDGYLSHVSAEKQEVIHEERAFSPQVNRILWNPYNTDFLTKSNSAVLAWEWDRRTSENPLIPEYDINTQAGTYSITNTEIRWQDENTFITMATTVGGGSFVFHHAERNLATGETDYVLLHREGDIGYYTETGNLPSTAWSSDLSKVVYSDWDNPTRFYIADELFAEEENASLTLQADRFRQIEWSPDDTMIATAGELGDESAYNFLVEIWDAKTGEPLSSFFIEWLMHYDHFIWNPDGKTIAVTSNRTTGGGCEMSIGVYDIQIGEFYEIAPTMPRLYWGKYCDDPIFYSPEPQASWSPDGGMIAVSFDDAVRIFNIREVTVPIKIPIEKINTLDWHESGKYLAGGASDGTIYVWDMSALMEN